MGNHREKLVSLCGADVSGHEEVTSFTSDAVICVVCEHTDYCPVCGVKLLPKT